MSYDYCVVGNGLIGSAAAAALSRTSARGCLIGAEYGAGGRVFSSHEDDFRIVRSFHEDPYWEDLTVRNLPKLRAVMQETGLPLFRPVPVYYGGPAAPDRRAVACRDFAGRGFLSRFIGKDRDGGMLDPKLYVAALNRCARSRGVDVIQGVVDRIERVGSTFRVRTATGALACDRLVDARGVHVGLLDAGRVAAVGKVVFFTEAVGQDVDGTYCFLAALDDGGVFEETYGCCNYTGADGGMVSKFGFTERDPVPITSVAAAVDWFRGGYANYPYVRDAHDWLAAAFGEDVRVLATKPCAFTVTPDRRPVVVADGDWLTITGCNGGAAKCCQALAEDALTLAGFL